MDLSKLLEIAGVSTAKQPITLTEDQNTEMRAVVAQLMKGVEFMNSDNIEKVLKNAYMAGVESCAKKQN